MKKIIFTLLIITIFTSVYSEKIFSILSKGSVKDNATGLVWTRCSLSTDDRPINNFNCEGTKKKYTWDEAVAVCRNLNFDGRSDWRLPNIRELQSIIYHQHYSVGYNNPAQVVADAFPNVVTDNEMNEMTKCWQKQKVDYPDTYPWPVDCSNTDIHYWSSTIYKKNAMFAWFADFYNGNTSFNWRTDWLAKKNMVRCVAGP